MVISICRVDVTDRLIYKINIGVVHPYPFSVMIGYTRMLVVLVNTLGMHLSASNYHFVDATDRLISLVCIGYVCIVYNGNLTYAHTHTHRRKISFPFQYLILLMLVVH